MREEEEESEERKQGWSLDLGKHSMWFFGKASASSTITKKENIYIYKNR